MDLKCKSKLEKSSKVLHTLNAQTIFLVALEGSKTDSDGSSLRQLEKFSCYDEHG